MKKCLITYLFIVCSICLHPGVFANPAKTSRTTAAIKSSYATTPSGVFTFQKANLALTDYLPYKSGDIFFQHGSIRVLYPVVSYFTAEPNFFERVSCHVQEEMNNKKEIERVLKDHLLHLFPFHYFW